MNTLGSGYKFFGYKFFSDIRYLKLINLGNFGNKVNFCLVPTWNLYTESSVLYIQNRCPFIGLDSHKRGDTGLNGVKTDLFVRNSPVKLNFPHIVFLHVHCIKSHRDPL